MMGAVCHAPFCEGLGVKFPGATHPRSAEGRQAEAALACNILNQMMDLGRPESHAIDR